MDPILRKFYMREIFLLETEIQRIKNAQRVMRLVTRALKTGRHDVLAGLGFSAEHIGMLAARRRQGEEIFPSYVWSGNRQMLRRIRQEIAMMRRRLGRSSRQRV